MKIYLMTDLEGVCGVLDHDDWVNRESRYYEDAKTLLVQEVNAALEGFFEEGADEVLVLDGHGAGGIRQAQLDPRSTFQRGFVGPWPCGLDASFDAVAWVGQHAKAGTPFAHIPHTQWFDRLDFRINGVSVGEFGQLAFCAACFGVRPLFASGDMAFTGEACALVPGIETVAVKRGLMPGSGDELDADAYRRRNGAAVHLHPEVARKRIRDGAGAALRRFRQDRQGFKLLDVEPPFTVEQRCRSDGSNAAYKATASHPTDLVQCLNSPLTRIE